MHGTTKDFSYGITFLCFFSLLSFFFLCYMSRFTIKFQCQKDMHISVKDAPLWNGLDNFRSLRGDRSYRRFGIF